MTIKSASKFLSGINNYQEIGVNKVIFSHMVLT